MIDWLNPWLLLVPAAMLLAFLFIWRFYGIGRAIQTERARELFRLQHEHLEKLFLEKAAATGLPRGLRWIGCAFSNDVELVRERDTGSIVALVGATIRFEAIEGGDMEGLPAVPLPRQGTAVLRFASGEWTTLGRAIFNLNPQQVLQHFASTYDPVHNAQPE